MLVDNAKKKAENASASVSTIRALILGHKQNNRI